MGREVRRVALDFEWPLRKVWSGFLTPESLHEQKCETCDGSGYSAYAQLQHSRWYGYVPFDPSETGSKPLKRTTPAVWAFAERNVASAPEFYGAGIWAIEREADRLARLWNGMWSHHLHQDDVDALVEAGRLYDFTHRWVQGNGWQPIDPKPTITAEQVNLWSLGGFGHDGINCWVVVRAACKRAGEPETCDRCEGHGSTEKYEGQRAEAEAWVATDPPEGEGWQLWETVSEGSPISPVFATDVDLAQWCTENKCTVNGPMRSFDAALAFVRSGWAPSFMASPETGVVDGMTWVGEREAGEVSPNEQ